MRKLASIQKIEKLIPIENADTLESAKILGWNVVVKKGEFVEGDKCVYCEIDSIMPEKPEFEFLRQRHFRIKTVKLRKTLSQGIAFPMNIIEGDFEIDDDVTEILGVGKWAPPEVGAHMAGTVKGRFPEFLHKTDETRLQSVPTVLEEIRGHGYYISVKMDGTSGTFYNKDGEFGACSRNLILKESDKNVYWKIAKKYKLEEVLKDKNLCIQGELVGPGVQKNRLGLTELELFVFDIFDIDKQEYFNLFAMQDFCKKNGLQIVPIEEEGVFHDESFYTLEQLLEKAKGRYPISKKHREGIVIRTITPIESERLHKRLSFKVLNNDFLLKDE